jgi:hypothetical protein
MCLLIHASLSLAQTEWFDINGTVTFNGTPLCAMVLANGQDMFTCGDDLGSFDLNVPLDGNGKITLYGFCSGFSPFKVVLTPEQAQNYAIRMTLAFANSDIIEAIVQTEPCTKNPNYVRVYGTVSYRGTPLCAMVLANGQNMFSCGANLGVFDLEVPLDGYGKITLYVFCSGFAPYKDVFVPNGEVSISGNITYDCVPTTQDSGLDYENTFQKPIRRAVVKAIKSSNGTVLDSTVSDSIGNFTVTAPSNTQVLIRVEARVLESGPPSWDVQVVDNTAGQALYVMDSAPFDSGTEDIFDMNLNAPSGWGGSGYTSPRVAAPFAILDTVYDANNLVVFTDPSVPISHLLINWSINNVPVDGNTAQGQIGSSHYNPNTHQLYILGAEGNDTDEYDNHVIAHEWSHYFMDMLSRSDSLGGPHGLSEKLDPRLAFSEGFCNAFSGMALDDPIFIDTYGTSQARTGIAIDLEDNGYEETVEGWFSETSIQAILYDLFDSTNDGDDTVSLGFTPLYDVLADKQKNAVSFTTIFSFISFLKDENPAHVLEINDLVAGESITSTAVDEFDGTQTETNDGGNPNSLPVYTLLTDGGEAMQLCGSGEFGYYNKHMNNRFFYFEITSTGTYTITAVPDADGDPDIILYSQGDFIDIAQSGSDGETEVMTVSLSPGIYSGVIYEYKHMEKGYKQEECFDVSLD